MQTLPVTSSVTHISGTGVQALDEKQRLHNFNNTYCNISDDYLNTVAAYEKRMGILLCLLCCKLMSFLFTCIINNCLFQFSCYKK